MSATRVQFMRNALAKVAKVAGPMVTSIIRTVFVPCGRASLVTAQFGKVVRMLERSLLAVAEMPEDARDELLAFTAFPSAHWQIRSTNPLEQPNKEIKRRADVVGTFSNPAAATPGRARPHRAARRMGQRCSCGQGQGQGQWQGKDACMLSPFHLDMGHLHEMSHRPGTLRASRSSNEVRRIRREEN